MSDSGSALATRLRVVEGAALRFVETGEARVDSWEIEWDVTPAPVSPRRDRVASPEAPRRRGPSEAPRPAIPSGPETLPALFVGVPAPVIDRGMRHFYALDLAAGETLIARGERHPALVLTLRGQLEASRDGVRSVVPSGAVLGLRTIFGDGSWPATLRAASDCRLLVLELDAYRQLRAEASPMSLVIEEFGLGTLLDRAVEARGELARRLTPQPLEEVLPARGLLGRLGAMFGAGGLAVVRLDRTDALLASPLFRNATEADLRRLADAMDAVSAWPGEPLITQGVESSCLYVVASGRVDRITTGRSGAVLHDSLGAGELFGAWSVLRSAPSPVSYVAAERTVLLELDKLAWAEVGTASDAAGSVLRLAVLRALARELARIEARIVALEGGGPAAAAEEAADPRFVTIDPAARR